MLSLIIAAVCVGLSSQQVEQLPHGHQLHAMIDKAFQWLDANHNGQLEVSELISIESKLDLNSDGTITIAEYAGFRNVSEAAVKPMFDTYDTDGDGVLPVNYLEAYLPRMDTNGDGVVNMKEFEHYETQLILCVYGEHGHGHATHGHTATCL